MKLKFLFGAMMLCFLAGNVSAQTPVVDQFLAMLDGTEATAEAAVKKFGSADVIANGMIPFGKNPQIVSREDNCLIVSLTDGDEVNQYWICEEGGKIVEFDLYFDDEEGDESEEEED
ncbi:MAG: hypothetical protein IPH24_11895 [Crocinitomicaceae bacterium]|nr:hypothetical protein [Crocinitomicaceae bacterium]